MRKPLRAGVELKRENANAADPLMAWLAQLMDTQFVIPGTNIRFGLDPLIGLLPGIGDTASAVVSVALIIQSSRYGIPKIVLARMGLNILINWLAGCVPGVGDVLSVWFKSNARNYALFQKHAGVRRGSTVRDWLFVIGIIGVVGAAMAGSFLLLFAMISEIVKIAHSQPWGLTLRAVLA